MHGLTNLTFIIHDFCFSVHSIACSDFCREGIFVSATNAHHDGPTLQIGCKSVQEIYESLITANISTQATVTPVRRLKHAVPTQYTLTCMAEQIYLETDLHCSYSESLNRHPSNKDATNKLDKTVRPIYGHAARCWSSIISQWHYPHRLAVDREALIRMIV